MAAAFSTALRARVRRCSSTGSSLPPASIDSRRRTIARSASSSAMTRNRAAISSNSPATAATYRERMRLAPYVDAERDRIVATLLEWLRIPSISAHPERAADVRASAELCARLLAEAGLEHVTIIETAGAPAV